MKVKGFSLVVILVLLLSGCSTVSQRQAKLVSKAVYATQDALTAGRVDLAKAYNAQAVRLVAAPAKRVKVAPVESKGTRYVVLPVEYSGTPALTVGSKALVALVSGDKALQRQFNAEAGALATVEKAADKVIAEKEAIIERAEAKAIVECASFWGRVAFWGKMLAVGAAIVAGCYFFPFLIPILGRIASILWGFLTSAVTALLNLFRKKPNEGP